LCVLGYRACVNDSITLNCLIAKELPESGLLWRLRLKIARHQAARSLSRARGPHSGCSARMAPESPLACRTHEVLALDEPGH
jgi:hypothetical protein